MPSLAVRRGLRRRRARCRGCSRGGRLRLLGALRGRLGFGAALRGASSSSFFVLRLAACSCFCCISSCWRGISSWRLALLLCARRELFCRDERAGAALRRLLDDRRALGLVALDEHALLAHFDLDRARLAGAIRPP